jgi:hypothetical protein
MFVSIYCSSGVGIGGSEKISKLSTFLGVGIWLFDSSWQPYQYILHTLYTMARLPLPEQELPYG